jgi:hypothetical protein
VFDKGVFASGNLVANSGTASSSTTTGALVVAGGAGISGALYIANTGDVSANIGTTITNLNTLDANIDAFITYANTKIGTNNNSNLVVAATTTSISTTSGALVVVGGTGIGGDIVVGGAIVPGTDNTGFIGNATNTWANGQFTNLTVDSTLNVRAAIDLADSDVLRFGSSDDWEFFHDGTGNFIDLNVGNLIIRDNTTQRASFSRTTGNLVLDSTTTSTSTTTGALVVRGGVGIAGTLYTGALNINGAYQFPSSDGTSGQVLTTNGSGLLTFANVSSGGGAAGFSQSTVTTLPTGDYGAGEESGIGTGSAATDAFEVPFGTLYYCMEPRGTIVTVDLET